MASRRTVALLVLAAAVVGVGARAVAQDAPAGEMGRAEPATAEPSTIPAPAVEPTEGAARVTPPPDPSQREPELIAQVHLGAVLPFERNDICPGDALCVLGGGAVVGVEVERRWPFGLGVLVGYDAWFVESGGVFELGVVQIVRAGLKYVFGDDWLIHPAVQLGAGALIFGDTLAVSTVGGAVELGASAELELTESVALTFGVQGWLFTTSPFTTSRDRTPRSEGLGLNASLQLNVGLSILAESGVR
jgi:hypothetical protein